jgi:hypothetical protein
VAHTFNPSTREAEAGRFLRSRPVYKVSFRTARATQRNPVSKNQKTKTKTKTNKQKNPTTTTTTKKKPHKSWKQPKCPSTG